MSWLGALSGGGSGGSTAVATFSSYIELGASPYAASGLVRVGNNVTAVAGRNAANSADVSMLGLTSANLVQLGEDTDAAGLQLRSASSGTAIFTSGTLIGTFDATGLTLGASLAFRLGVADYPTAGLVRVGKPAGATIIICSKTSGNLNGEMLSVDASNVVYLGGANLGRVQVDVGSTNRCRFEGSGVSIVGGAGSYGSGTGVVFLANASVAPSTDPTGGGVLYASGGALYWRGSSGTVSMVAPA